MPKGRRNLIYPYKRLKDDLALSVTDVRFDGEVPDRDPIIYDFRTADLSAVAQAGWLSFEVGLEASVPTDALDEMEQDDRDPIVVVAVDCAATNLRRSITLEHQGGGRWTGSLSMSREQIVGQVLLRAVLAARVGDGLRREVGESQLWTLHADTPAIPIIEGNLPVRWVDFPTFEAIPDSARKDAFFADLSEDAPVVYLNLAFEGLAELLSDDDRRPLAELVLREAEYRRIGTSVWLGMFNVAAAGIDLTWGDDGEDDDEGEPGLPTVEWQRSVLQTLMPRMFDESEAEILRKIVKGRVGDESREVQTQAAAAISRIVDSGALSLKRRIKQLSGVDS
jgi:hypothetical protein